MCATRAALLSLVSITRLPRDKPSNIQDPNDREITVRNSIFYILAFFTALVGLIAVLMVPSFARPLEDTDRQPPVYPIKVRFWTAPMHRGRLFAFHVSLLHDKCTIGGVWMIQFVLGVESTEVTLRVRSLYLFAGSQPHSITALVLVCVGVNFIVTPLLALAGREVELLMFDVIVDLIYVAVDMYTVMILSVVEPVATTVASMMILKTLCQVRVWLDCAPACCSFAVT